MKNKFSVGDKKIHQFIVSEKDVAAFNGKMIHQVCSTFVLAREIEWSSRLFVLEMIEEDEEGIGTELSIKHRTPAFVGEQVTIEASVDRFDNNELICKYTARTGERIVATGITGQKILKKEKIKELFSRYK